MAQPFSSGNPVVDALFSREFAQRQAEQAALEAAATRGVQRQQIQAQSELARAQQQSTAQQQQYNNLFREREFQSREKGDEERNALFKRQLDIQEKATRTSTDEERRKALIIDRNATAINDAQRANALYKINFEKSLAAEKANRTGLFGLGSTAAKLDDPNNVDRKKIQNQAFDTVRQQLLSEKGGALDNLIPDPDSFTFKPVQYDETGKAIALPLPTPTPTTGTGGYDYMGNPVDVGAAAGLGPAKPVIAPDATPNAAGLGPVRASPSFATPSGAQPGGMTFSPNADAATIAGLGIQPVVDKFLGSAANMFTVRAPAPAIIRIPIQGLGLMEVSQADAEEAERQLRSVPPENVAATAAAIRDGLLKSGRARIVTPTP